MEPYDMKKKPIDQTAEEMLAAFEKNEELYMGMWGHKPTLDEIRSWLVRTGSYTQADLMATPDHVPPLELQLKKVRQRVGMPVKELAQKSGVSRSYIWRMENCDVMPTREIADQIARALGVRTAELYCHKK